MRRILILVILAAAIAAAAFALRSRGPAPEPVTLSGAVAQVIAPGQVQVYLTIENGATPNVLKSVSSPEAAEARIVRAGQVVIPAGARPSFAADGAFVVLTGVEGDLQEGRLLPIHLEFAPSGPAVTRARVETPSDPHARHRAGAAAPADPPPGLDLTASADGAGWRIALDLTDFTFAPEVPDPVHVPGEGHGHLYLNGLKLGRVYSDELRIGALPPGRHEVAVSLNGNTHMPYIGPDGPVARSVWIEVK